jgi:PAS domain-containing protein
MPAGVFVAEAPSGKLLLANEQLKQLLGRGIALDTKKKETAEMYALYRYGTDMLYPPDQMPLARGLLGESTNIDDLEARRPNGSRTLLQVVGTPIRDAEGSVIASVAIFQDITERKQGEEILRENEARLSEALTIARLGNWELDLASQKFTLTDQFYSIYRTTAEQQDGYQIPAMQFIQRFVHPDDADNIGAEIMQALESTSPTEEVKPLEHRILRADGSEGYVLSRFRVITDEHGRAIKTVGANQDITEQKLAELEREQLLAEVESAYRQYVRREWTQFLSEQHQGSWHIEHQPVGQMREQIMDKLDELQDEAIREGKIKAITGANNGRQSEPAIVAPIALRGEVIGTLSLQDVAPEREWTNEEMALVQTVSEQLGLTIENLRLFEETDRQATREKIIADMTRQVWASGEMDRVMQMAVEQLGRTLDASKVVIRLGTEEQLAQESSQIEIE